MPDAGSVRFSDALHSLGTDLVHSVDGVLLRVSSGEQTWVNQQVDFPVS